MASQSLETPLEPQASAGLLRTVAALSTGSLGPAEHDSSAWRPDTQHVSSAISRGTSFDPEFIEQLQRGNPRVLVWLKSTAGVLFQVALICFYVSFETLSGLLTVYVLNPDPPPKFKPLPSSIIVMNSGLSIIIGILITVGVSIFSERTPVARAIPKSCSALCQWKNILHYAFIGALFSVSAVFTMMAYSKLDAGLKKILDQLRLPVTAAMGTVIVGRRYRMHEWLALLIVLLSVCSFYMADVQHDAVTELHKKCLYPQHCFSEPSYDICALRVDGATILGAAVKDTRNVNGTCHDITAFPVKAAKTDWAGLMFSVAATFFNCMGSLFSERILKSTAAIPFPAQKVQMETTGFPVAIAMSFIVPLCISSRGGKDIWWMKNEAEGSGEGFFQGYNRLTLLAIAMDITNAWIGGIIVKKFSSLVKVISKCFVLLMTVFFSGTFLKVCHANPLPVTMYALAFTIAAATLLFAAMPKQPPKGEVLPAPCRQSASTITINSPLSSARGIAGGIQLPDGRTAVR